MSRINLALLNALIARAIASDDEEAKAKALEMARPAMLAYARGRCQESVAEDLVQDACLSMYRAIRTLRAPEAFLTCAFKALSRLMGHHFKRAAREPRPMRSDEHSPVLGTQSLQDFAIAEDDFHERLDSEPRRRQLRALLAGLGTESRRVLELWAQGASYQDISKSLGLKVTTVRMRIHHGLSRLRRLAEEKSMLLRPS